MTPRVTRLTGIITATDPSERHRSLDSVCARASLELLARELTLKHTPTLSFAYDDSVDRGMRINELLESERPDD